MLFLGLLRSSATESRDYVPVLPNIARPITHQDKNHRRYFSQNNMFVVVFTRRRYITAGSTKREITQRSHRNNTEITQAQGYGKGGVLDIHAWP